MTIAIRLFRNTRVNQATAADHEALIEDEGLTKQAAVSLGARVVVRRSVNSQSRKPNVRVSSSVQ
jgi:hypothetical protein